MLRPKDEQSSIHEHLLNNLNCSKKYNDSKFQTFAEQEIHTTFQFWNRIH